MTASTIGSVSAELFARGLEVFPGGTTRRNAQVAPYPPYVAGGRGHELIDVDGHRLIDLQGNYTVLVHGHAHPRVVEAAIGAVRRGACFGLPTSSELRLAEHLSHRIPSLERMRFANTGTEAVMMAIQAARAFTGRPGVLRFAGAYHGHYDAVVPASAPIMPAPLGDTLVTVALDDPDAVGRALEDHGDELACAVLDLMPNRAGLRPASAAFVEGLRVATRELGILLIVDEVITVRLHEGGLHACYGLVPDLVTLGKVVGGGFPIGVFGGRADVMQVFDARAAGCVSHGGTFTANPVSMSAGLAALELLDQPAIDRLNALGDRLREGLHGLGLCVNGRGSLTRILADEPARLWRESYRAGALLADNGLIALSTCMDEAVVDESLDRIQRAVGRCA